MVEFGGVTNGEGEQIAETLRIYGSSTAQNTTLNLVHVQDIDFSNPVTINDFIFSTTDQFTTINIAPTITSNGAATRRRRPLLRTPLRSRR